MQDSVVQQLDTLVSQLLTQYSWFIGLAQAIGGLGALCYVFTRVWGHLARNEEIDIVPLFRPVALAICLMSYGGIVNGVTSLSGALNEMTQPFIDSQKTLVDNLTKQKKTALAAKRQKTLGLIDTDHDGEESWMEILKAMFDADSATQFGADMMSYSVQNVVDQLMTTLGEVLYLFAFLCLKFLVSFFIVVLLILNMLHPMELNKHVNIWKVDKLMDVKLFAYLYTVNHHIYLRIEIVEKHHHIDDVVVHHYHLHVIILHQDVWEIVIAIVNVIEADIMIDEVDILLHQEIIGVDNHHRHLVDEVVQVVIRQNHQRKKNVDIHDQVQVNQNK